MVLPTYLGRGVWLQTLLKNNFSAKYDNSYFFVAVIFGFLCLRASQLKYTIENRLKPTQA